MTSLLNRLIGMVRSRKALVKNPGNAGLLSRCVDPSGLLPPEGLIRLGTAYGGWMLPKDNGLNPSSICYLAGAGEDISFDCALVEAYGCVARIIDPTPRAIRHFSELSEAVATGRPFSVNKSTTDFYTLSAASLSRMLYLPYGLSDTDGEVKFYLPRNPDHVSCSMVNLQKTEEFFVAQCHRVSTLMAMNGDAQLDLCKMDIEGGEYMVIRDMIASGTLPRILLIEFDEAHTPPDEAAQERIDSHIRLLVGAGMRCVAVEGSNATFVGAG